MSCIGMVQAEGEKVHYSCDSPRQAVPESAAFGPALPIARVLLLDGSQRVTQMIGSAGR